MAPPLSTPLSTFAIAGRAMAAMPAGAPGVGVVGRAAGVAAVAGCGVGVVAGVGVLEHPATANAMHAVNAAVPFGNRMCLTQDERGDYLPDALRAGCPKRCCTCAATRGTTAHPQASRAAGGETGRSVFW
jgi:hypothetical protein